MDFRSDCCKSRIYNKKNLDICETNKIRNQEVAEIKSSSTGASPSIEAIQKKKPGRAANLNDVKINICTYTFRNLYFCTQYANCFTYQKDA